MREHHRRAVGRLVERFGNDPNFPALIIGGSIARGWERDDSDVDFVLLAIDDEYARRKATNAFAYYATDLCDFPGGYVDGKIVDWQFLQDVAERGNEPSRAAYVGVTIAYSRVPGLDDLLKRITTYPAHERTEKIRSFYAQVQALQWYVGEAAKRSDHYLMARVTADLILYGGRMILAHNQIFFPYHKWFMTELGNAPAKPDNLMDLIDQLLTQPCKTNADAFCNAILNFTTWDTPPEGWPSRFMQDTEWAWRAGHTPISDW